MSLPEATRSIDQLAGGLENAAEVLTRSALAKGLDIASASKLAHKIESLADRQLPQLSERGIPLACRPKCCHCCHQMIYATELEIAVLAQAVLAWPSPERDAFILRLQEYAEAVEPDRPEGFIRTRLACPFLQDELCSIYEDRPLVCRGLTSPSAEMCRDVRERVTPEPPYGPNGEMDITAALRRGIFTGLAPQGNTSRPNLEMPLALLQVLTGQSSQVSEGRPWHRRFEAPVHDPIGPPIVSQERAEFLQAAMQQPFEEALALLRTDDNTNALMRIAAPKGYRSVEEVVRWRKHFEQSIEDAGTFEPWNPYEGYHAICDVSTITPGHQPFSMLEPMRNLGRLLHDRIAAKVAPELLEPLGARKPGKLRLGIAGDLGSSSGSAWVQGLLGGLDRAEFEAYALKTSGLEDAVSYTIKDLADKHWRLAGHPLEIVRFIRSLDLDYLIFPEIGGVGAEYQTAIFRLARKQALGWGCPFTSGLPTIDHYLSGEFMEAPSDVGEYTEELVLMPRTGVCLSEAPMIEFDLRREHLGLPDGFLVAYPQYVVKWLPEWDHLLQEIISRTSGTLVCFDFGMSNARQIFQERMARLGIPVFWLSRMNRYLFRNAIRLFDVNLDSPAWSGGLTAIECLTAGAPFVTLPGPFLRQRLAYGFCKQAGAEGLAAKDESDYIDLAAMPERVRAAMKDLNADALYGDVAPVRALEDLIRSSAT